MGAIGRRNQGVARTIKKARKPFLIQQLPDILSNIAKAVSRNLSIDEIPIADNGNGHIAASCVKGLQEI